ncbi:hypothetical protein KSS87_010863 [Heliosperma pusillum]|nr:hypothetical protein KSS87_010863 [Heliosperma pusillum]
MDSSSSSSTTFEVSLKEEWHPVSYPMLRQLDIRWRIWSERKGNAKIILKLSQAPEKSHEVQSDHSSQGEDRKLEPDWLERFFKRTFFEPCSVHPVRRNELNKYCIDCDASLCQYCVSLAPHEDHRLLKIYRHVYKDVVPLDEIEQHIDCSQIQVEAFAKKDDDNCPPFMSLDLLLQKGKQRPEPKSTTVYQPLLKATQESELKSVTFYQPLQKVEREPERVGLGHFGHKAKQEPHLKMMGIEPMVLKTNQELNRNKRTRKRKGIPHRAPFF